MSELAGVITAKKKSSHSWLGHHAISCWRGFARLAILFMFVAFMLQSTVGAQVPVYEVTPVESSIKFDVESSVPIKGAFSQWVASLTFKPTDVRTGVLEIKIQADSVDTGSGMITFVSTDVTQTGPATFDLEGDFTIRGVTKKEKLTLQDNRKGTSSGSITGTMAFDRKDYGMNSNIPFVKIANRAEVNVNLQWKRISGPPLVFHQ
jgi:polyisoprenoid-binding protein YceI